MEWLGRAQNKVIHDVKRVIGRLGRDPKVPGHRKNFAYNVEKDELDRLIVTLPAGRAAIKPYYPEQISAFILAEMRRLAERHVGGRTVKKAVVTVPAYFNNQQRQATKDAAKIAGLEILRIINEPTAAALAYSHSLDFEAEQTRNLLMFDFGGGTFDVTVLSVADGVLDVLATRGDSHLGGRDIDNKIRDYCI